MPLQHKEPCCRHLLAAEQVGASGSGTCAFTVEVFWHSMAFRDSLYHLDLTGPGRLWRLSCSEYTSEAGVEEHGWFDW